MRRITEERRAELESAGIELDSIKRLWRQSHMDYQIALPGDLASRNRHWHILEMSAVALHSLLGGRLSGAFASIPVHDICEEMAALRSYQVRLLFTLLTGEA